MKKSIRKVKGQGVEVEWSIVTHIGVDLGDRVCQFVAIDAEGQVVGEGSLPTTAEAFEKRFAEMGPKKIAIETGTHSPWVNRLLRRLGHHVTVANSRKVRLIHENRRKNDRIDAEYLARLVRLDRKLLHPVKHRDQASQKVVSLLRSRAALVRTRSSLITQVRCTFKSVGMRVPQCSVEAFVKRARPIIPKELRDAVEPVLTVIETVGRQIAAFDRKVEQMGQREYPDTQLLMQVKGVGALTSMAYIATTGGVGKFDQSRTAGAWLGLVPGQYDSSQSNPQQRISKEGDSYLRSLLINCAHYILGPFGEDCDLRRHGLAIAARGGKNAKKRAVVAVARKLAVLLHALWRTRSIYEPLRNTAPTPQVA